MAMICCQKEMRSQFGNGRLFVEAKSNLLTVLIYINVQVYVQVSGNLRVSDSNFVDKANVPLSDSTNALSVGLPGREKPIFTPFWYPQGQLRFAI